MTRANSSWAAARHSDVPSALMTSRTYCMFFPTATFAYGFDRAATSKILEKT